jgi:hypothetical protein
MRAHHEVVVKKVGGTLTVGADPSHHRREMDDQRRLRFPVQPDDLILVTQIELAARRREDGCTTLLTKLADDVAAEKPGAAGHQNALFAPEIHECGGSIYTANRMESADAAVSVITDRLRQSAI